MRGAVQGVQGEAGVLCSRPVTALQELFTRPLEPQHQV